MSGPGSSKTLDQEKEKVNYSIYIELGYGVLQSTKAFYVLRFIFNFKSEMIDLIHSI
jgi:hypothetical protein